jgi:hypothetical protein
MLPDRRPPKELPEPETRRQSDLARVLSLFRPELLVSEHEVEMVGTGRPGWSPEVERPPAPTDRCLLCGDRIDRGALVYCPECYASGVDHKLIAQLQVAAQLNLLPPAQPRTPRPKPKADTPGKGKARARPELVGGLGPSPRGRTVKV